MIQNLAKKIYRFYEQNGISEIEIFASQSKQNRLEIRHSKIQNVDNAIENSVSIRIKKKNKMLKISSNDSHFNSLEPLLSDSLSAINHVDNSPWNRSLKHSDIPVKRLYQYDPFYSKLKFNDKLEIALDSESQIAKQTKTIKADSCFFSDSENEYIHLNNKGFQYIQSSSTFSKAVSVFSEFDGRKQIKSAGTFRRYFSDLESNESLAEKAIERLKRLKYVEKPVSMKIPVIIEYPVMKTFISLLLQALNGNLIYRKSSFLQDSLNKQIFSEKLNIIENPLLEKFPNSSLMDDEYHLLSKKSIVKSGVITSYLTNNESAKKLKVNPSGNSFSVTGSSSGISTTNIQVEGGSYHLQALSKIMHRGLIVTSLMGSHFHMINGDLSRGAEAVWVDNGEIQYGLHEFTISCNVLDLFNRLIYLGNDISEFDIIQCPSVLFEEIQIHGK